MSDSGTLRPMREDDLSLVLEWRNSEPIRKNMYTHHEISPPEHRTWWTTQSVNPETKLLIFECDGSPAGVVTFTNYSGPGGTASWAFYSGDLSRRGIGALMEKAALAYAFEELKLRRLECEVLSFNISIVNFHLKHGFSLEGISRCAYVRGSNSYDIYKLSMLSNEWERFIRPNLKTLGQKGGNSFLGKEVRKKVHIDESRIQAFIDASGDSNPMHIDAEFAIEAGMSGPIAHGMLIGSLFSQIIATDLPGPGSIYVGQTLNFLAPVFVGAEVEVLVTVQSHIGRMVRAKTVVSCDGTVCVEGVADILAPK